MYRNPKFEEKDREKVLAFMEAHSFIMLIGYHNEYPVATQIPVKIEQRDGEIYLIGHVMRKTDHYHAFAKNEKVLAVFTGAHAYISAAVYQEPAVASTWNYKSVQAKGVIRMLDEVATREVIRELTNRYEDPTTSKAAFHHLSDEYVEKHLKAISGFEILVKSLDSVFKLSQNHSSANRTAIIDHLAKREDQNDQQVAQEMRSLDSLY